MVLLVGCDSYHSCVTIRHKGHISCSRPGSFAFTHFVRAVAFGGWFYVNIEGGKGVGISEVELATEPSSEVEVVTEPSSKVEPVTEPSTCRDAWPEQCLPDFNRS